MARILIADDEEGLREFIEDTLREDGHGITAAKDGLEAIAELQKHQFDLVLTDLKMPGASGIDVLQAVTREQPEAEVVVLTAYGSVSSAVEAMRLGAFDYLQKPLDSPEALSMVVTRALERRALKNTQARVERERRDQELPLTHGDDAMEPVVRAIEKVAPTEANVLLLGESGTGKELAARSIHRASQRSQGPFMAINCAALSESLLESELFGHEKGAFTGATERRRGRVELAEEGTFFLDEIGELDIKLQAKLLRVLQERRFERVGGTRSLEANVRWVAATNRDLRAMIDAGTFREDLYHRLSVFPIRMPPLRERKDDILPIARLLLTRTGRDLGKPRLVLSPAVESKLLAWPWPGNVRELANVLERAAILAEGNELQVSDLWLEPAARKPTSHQPGSAPVQSLAALEREAIVNALAATDHNRRRTAELLQIGERTLYDKIKRYHIE